MLQLEDDARMASRFQGKLPDKHFAFKGMGRVKDHKAGEFPATEAVR